MVPLKETIDSSKYSLNTSSLYIEARDVGILLNMKERCLDFQTIVILQLDFPEFYVVLYLLY